MDTTDVCVTVTDANGCMATDCFLIMAQDARCFAGNSSISKVKICHHTGNASHPWVQICIADDAVQAHLNNNSFDYIGNCIQARFMETGTELQGMHVFPNPATREVNIRYEGIETSDCDILILDITGREVLRTSRHCSTGGNEWNLEIGHLVSGLYQLVIRSNDRYAIAKLTIE